MNDTTPTPMSPEALEAAASFTFATGEVGPPDRQPGLSDHEQTLNFATEAVAMGVESFEPPRAVDPIEFRVMRAGAPVRRLRLTGNRYTFGSADGCSIRLTDPSVRPMHAVLIRDAKRILLRAYSVPVEVNEKTTTETTLTVGDVLRIGAYRFELLPTTSESTSATRPPLASLGTLPVAPQEGLPQLDSADESLPQPRRLDPISISTAPPDHFHALDTELPVSDDEIWRERLRRDVEQWRARQAECDRREARCDDREANLRGRESELWARAEHLHRREAQLQAQESAAMQIHEEFAQRQQELISLRDEALARRRAYERRENEFRTLENQFQQQEQAYQERIDEASRQIVQSRQQAQTAAEAVQRMREQVVALNSQIDDLSAHGEPSHVVDEARQQEQRRLVEELERARDEAIDCQGRKRHVATSSRAACRSVRRPA